MRRTVPPSAEIQAEIDKVLSKGMVDDPQKILSELGRLGARLIIQRAVEDEFDTWLGRARYERRPERQRGLRNYDSGLRNGFRPPLIPRATEPRVELVLDRPLNDQPGAEPRELRQHLLRVINHPLRQQLVDARLYLRRWRYRASHGVGLLHRLAGLEGTYAVATTAPNAQLQQSLECAQSRRWSLDLT